MTRLAEQHDAGVGEPVEKAAEGGIVDVRERLGSVTDESGDRFGFDQCLGPLIHRPAMRANQRHEADFAQILLLEVGLGASGCPDQPLPVGVADRHHEPAADRQLL